MILQQFLMGQNADVLGLTGKERFSLNLGEDIKPGMEVTVSVEGGSVDSFKAKLRIDTESEVTYYKARAAFLYMSFIAY